eukprot:CAMPEP_0174342934 /NCGR_PEP_ID=MMETSP0810-20121108/26554_1 /TAXON_ID=73025 ORGANISM="Eutreptiella gymnastica-like, Strain CCMP1594" /NCGR_SAMPLE_ID=MMETSP0810 /ASSEMBLY_ACC=CAM_ASM_000659 /LENGTH=77 /DNA_ID=CAMNT_0015465359 /DNA_START=42 /DNA_END=272 /DNA_ORIENTATION=-
MRAWHTPGVSHYAEEGPQTLIGGKERGPLYWHTGMLVISRSPHRTAAILASLSVGAVVVRINGDGCMCMRMRMCMCM